MESRRKMKNLLLVIAVSSVISISSYAETLGDPDIADSTDEVKEESDEESRAAIPAKAFGAAAVGPGANLMPGPGPFRVHLCYVCTDCPNVLKNTTYKACSYSTDSSKNNKCVVYSEQYRHMKKPWYIRGCASERGSCMDIRRAHSAHGDIVKLNFCHECEGDKCNMNGAGRPPATLAAFFVLVVTPLVAKHTLS